MADAAVMKSVTSEDARCVFRSIMQDFAQLIPAKLTRSSRRRSSMVVIFECPVGLVPREAELVESNQVTLCHPLPAQ